MNKPFSRSEYRELRSLTLRAYERELNQELQKLYDVFHRWSAGEMLAGEMTDAIHEFHQGPNRDLFKLYNGRDYALLVARGVAKGLLSRDEVGAKFMERLDPMLEWISLD